MLLDEEPKDRMQKIKDQIDLISDDDLRDTFKKVINNIPKTNVVSIEKPELLGLFMCASELRKRVGDDAFFEFIDKEVMVGDL